MDVIGSTGVSLDEFVHVHGLSLTRFAFLITGDRGLAEDVVQDVLLAMHRRFGSWLPIEDPLRYARRCIVNAHVSGLRRRRVVEILSDDPPDAPVTDAGAPDLGDDELWATLTCLPARQRAVLVLRYYLGQTDRDIAELLDCQESSVRSLAARAFKSLRPILHVPGEVVRASS